MISEFLQWEISFKYLCRINRKLVKTQQHKLLSAHWCLNQPNSSSTTHFSNLSPKSNKLPKYVCFTSFLSLTREREKDLIVNICFPFPSSLWSTAAPPGHHSSSSSSTLPPSAASTHPPPIHPSIPAPARLSHWSSLKPECPYEDTLTGTFPQVARQLSSHHHTHHISHIKWPFVFFSLLLHTLSKRSCSSRLLCILLLFFPLILNV